jgi:Holliday junction resolvase-like predicted endonuclease
MKELFDLNNMEIKNQIEQLIKKESELLDPQVHQLWTRFKSQDFTGALSLLSNSVSLDSKFISISDSLKKNIIRSLRLSLIEKLVLDDSTKDDSNKTYKTDDLSLALVMRSPFELYELLTSNIFSYLFNGLGLRMVIDMKMGVVSLSEIKGVIEAKELSKDSEPRRKYYEKLLKSISLDRGLRTFFDYLNRTKSGFVSETKSDDSQSTNNTKKEAGELKLKLKLKSKVKTESKVKSNSNSKKNKNAKNGNSSKEEKLEKQQTEFTQQTPKKEKKNMRSDLSTLNKFTIKDLIINIEVDPHLLALEGDTDGMINLMYFSKELRDKIKSIREKNLESKKKITELNSKKRAYVEQLYKTAVAKRKAEILMIDDLRSVYDAKQLILRNLFNYDNPNELEQSILHCLKQNI